MNSYIPIQALVFFEVVARQQSFTKAADELCVTQSAVSKQIKNLEEYFERPLFDRKHRHIELTTDGQTLYDEIQPRISDIKHAVHHLRNKKHSKLVNVICTHAVAHYFLFPQVVQFNQLYPDITVNIISTNVVKQQDLLENDFAILYGHGNFAKLNAVKLFEEEIYPVVSAQQALPPIQRPQDLLSLKLIQLDPKKWNWMNWKTWFSHFDVPYQLPHDQPVYNQVTLALNACVLGLGTTLGWHFMVKDMLESKILKKVGDFSFHTGYADYLVHHENKILSESAQQFKTWMIETAQEYKHLKSAQATLHQAEMGLIEG